MNKRKRTRLTAAGYRIGSTAEFLGLQPAELGRRMKSSQSRVAKIEAGDPSVSIDLLIHALASLGCTRRQLAKVLASPAA